MSDESSENRTATQQSAPEPVAQINISKIATTVICAVVLWVGVSIHSLMQSVSTISNEMTKVGTSMQHHAKTLEKWEDALQNTQIQISDLKEEFRESKHVRSERISSLELTVSAIQMEQANRTHNIQDIEKLQKQFEVMQKQFDAIQKPPRQ